MYFLQFRPGLETPVVVREIPPHTREHALFDGSGVAMFDTTGPFVMTIDGIACYGAITVGKLDEHGKIRPLTRREIADYEENGLEERMKR